MTGIVALAWFVIAAVNVVVALRRLRALGKQPQTPETQRLQQRHLILLVAGLIALLVGSWATFGPSSPAPSPPVTPAGR